MNLVRLVSVALVAGAFAAIGCSSSSSGNVIITTKDTGVAKDTGGVVNDTGTGTPDTGTAGNKCTDGSDCSTCADRASCIDCNITANSAGNDAFNNFFTKECACTTGGACAGTGKCTSADPVCATPPGNMASQGCVDCMNALTGSEACIATAQKDCAADTSCKALLTAIQGCPAK